MSETTSGVAAAGVYTGGRIATNILGWARTFAVATAQIGALKWMLDRQESAWDHVAAKQINCVEVAVNEFVLAVDNLLPLFKEAYPDVPVAARLIPVSPQVEQYQQMVDNITNIPKSTEYMIAANHWHRVNYMARAELLSPGFTENFRLQMQQQTALMNGQLPIDELVAVTTDDAENAAATGRIGNMRMQTPASIGIRRLQLQQLGRDELGRRIDWMQRVSPVESEVKLDDLMIKPERRLIFSLELAQLLQNDLQNANNAAAQKAPYKMAELQTKLQRVVAKLSYEANKANMQNQFVPNFAAVFGPSVQGLISSISNSFAQKDTVDSPHLGGNLNPSSSGGGFSLF